MNEGAPYQGVHMYWMTNGNAWVLHIFWACSEDALLANGYHDTFNFVKVIKKFRV
jgi:hypothetical protein